MTLGSGCRASEVHWKMHSSGLDTCQEWRAQHSLQGKVFCKLADDEYCKELDHSKWMSARNACDSKALSGRFGTHVAQADCMSQFLTWSEALALDPLAQQSLVWLADSAVATAPNSWDLFGAHLIPFLVARFVTLVFLYVAQVLFALWTLISPFGWTIAGPLLGFSFWLLPWT